MRVYSTDNYRKHKRPDGWGSLCPDHVTEQHAQALLEGGVLVGGAIYNVDGDFAYRAQEHVSDRWHGHPIPWSRLPTAAAEALMAAGRLERHTLRKALRKALGSEFAR